MVGGNDWTVPLSVRGKEVLVKRIMVPGGERTLKKKTKKVSPTKQVFLQ